MKLIASGVTFSAAITRSPSFSRSASSVTITIRPLAMSLTTSSTASNWNVWSVLTIIGSIHYVPRRPEQLLLLLVLVIENHEHEVDHLALVATIASGRYMSRLLP